MSEITPWTYVGNYSLETPRNCGPQSWESRGTNIFSCFWVLTNMSGLAVCWVYALQGLQDTLAVFSGSISTYILRDIGWPDAWTNDIKKKKDFGLGKCHCTPNTSIRSPVKVQKYLKKNSFSKSIPTWTYVENYSLETSRNCSRLSWESRSTNLLSCFWILAKASGLAASQAHAIEGPQRTLKSLGRGG